MAPHLAPGVLDVIHEKFAAGMSPILIHQWLKALREKKGVDTPHLTNLRKALKGKRYKRGRVETRGKKATYTRPMVLRMDAKRKELIKKSNNEREVRWEDIRRGARAPLGHRSTVKDAFRREDIPVAARRPREKPQRTQEHTIERFQFAKDS